MAASKSVPRLLQQQPRRTRDEATWRAQQQGTTKGDLRTQVEAPKPSREREVGDLEQGERETHGCARTPPRQGR